MIARKERYELTDGSFVYSVWITSSVPLTQDSGYNVELPCIDERGADLLISTITEHVMDVKVQ